MQRSEMERKETAMQNSETMEVVYWRYQLSRDVLDSDGRYVGKMRGILVDYDWSIPQIVVEVRNDVLEEVGIEQSHKVLDVVLVNLPTSYVNAASDIVKLNTYFNPLNGSYADVTLEVMKLKTDFNSLRGEVSLYEVRR